MSDTEKITAILTAIQDDVKLMVMLRLMIANNLGVVSSPQLDAIMKGLGL